MTIGVKRAMSDQESKQSEVVPSPSDRPAERGQRDRDRDRGGRRRHRNQPRHLEASINMNELRELVDLITENGLTSFELEREGFRVKVGRGTFIEDQSARRRSLPVELKNRLPPKPARRRVARSRVCPRMLRHTRARWRKRPPRLIRICTS